MDPKSNLILTVSLSLCCVVKYAVFKEVWAGVVAYAFNLGTHKVEEARGVRSQPGLRNEFQDSQSTYIQACLASSIWF